MKALRLHDEPPPNCGAGDTMLYVKAVGMCGSDLHGFGEGSIRVHDEIPQEDVEKWHHRYTHVYGR